MKLIKFDLPIDGVKVKTIDELREHFTPEILDHFRSGLLAKWLVSRKLQDELEAVKALEEAENPVLLKELCEVFGIESDEVVIAAITKEPSKSFENINKSAQIYDELTEKIDFFIYKAIRLQCIGIDRFSYLGLSSDSEDKSKEAISDFTKNNIKAWFLAPENPDDYKKTLNLHNYKELLNQRYQLLSSITEDAKIPMLKKSLKERVNTLAKILGMFDQVTSKKKQLDLLRFLSENHGLFLKGQI